jgi:hypothetical protein
VPDEPGRDRGLRDRDGLDATVDLLGVVDVGTLDDGGRRAQRLQVLLVRVGLAEAGQALVGRDLDDRPQRERLVHADRVQQRRIGERHRRDRHPWRSASRPPYRDRFRPGAEPPSPKDIKMA